MGSLHLCLTKSSCAQNFRAQVLPTKPLPFSSPKPDLFVPQKSLHTVRDMLLHSPASPADKDLIFLSSAQKQAQKRPASIKHLHNVQSLSSAPKCGILFPSFHNHFQFCLSTLALCLQAPQNSPIHLFQRVQCLSSRLSRRPGDSKEEEDSQVDSEEASTSLRPEPIPSSLYVQSAKSHWADSMAIQESERKQK